MANVDRVSGARPVKHLDGSPYNGATTRYYVASSDSVAIFPGDFVKSSGTGDAAGVPGVAQAAATESLRGAVVSVEPVTDESLPYRAASTERYVNVADAPDIVFEIQESGALAVTDINRNADITVAAGDTATGRSGMELDSSDIKDATAQLRVLGLSQRPDNEVGTNAKWLVVINEHELKGTAGS